MADRIPFIPEPIFTFATDVAGIWIRGGSGMRQVLAVAALLAAVAGILFFGADFGPEQIPAFHNLAALFGVSAAVLIIGALAYQRALERSERAARIDEIEKEVEAHPDKAKPVWDLASAKLETYVARNLSHVSWIFVLVLIVMSIGFLIIGWGIYEVFSSENIAPSVVAAVSGIVVEFIAATFLLIYRSTMEQAKEYVAMLERINAVGMSAQLLESIEDTDPKVRDKVRAELASSLLHMYSQSHRTGSQ